MTLRRSAPIAVSMGTTWPRDVRDAIYARDGGCTGPRAGMPGPCGGSLSIDHIRASHGMGMKSPSVVSNGTVLCFVHHELKTRAGRTWRPLLLAYLERFEDPHAACVDPCSSLCPAGGSR